jgi:hypothetical protein
MHSTARARSSERRAHRAFAGLAGRAAAWAACGACVLGCSAADGGGSSGELGDPCLSAGDCLSGICLRFQANFEGIGGVCTTSCSSSADCASGGACLPDPTGTVPNACFKRCASAADCSSGPACVWDEGANSGLCTAVAVTVCSLLVGASDCDTCINNNCCNAYEECKGDVTCGKDFAACGGGACTSKLAGSSDTAESTLGGCMGSACAGICP